MWKKFKEKMSLLWKEIKARWGSTSPYLFRVIQRISATFAWLSGIAVIIQAVGYQEWLPKIIVDTAGATMLISSILVYVVSKLPVDTDKASIKVLDAIEATKPEDKPSDSGPE